MADIIFDDLMIDTTIMISDPEAFYNQCREAADELVSILKAEDSAKHYLATLPKEALNVAEYDKLENSLYEWAEEQPIQVLAEMAAKLRKFAGLIEYLGENKAIYELANNQGKMDKRTAHAQYQRLREPMNKWVEFVGMFTDKEFPKLPPMPGNYGSTNLTHYVFEFENGSMMNYMAVSKRLGIPVTNMMDTVEYVESHPDCGCVVKKVQD